IPFDDADAAGLPLGSRPYVVTPDRAVHLSLINSRLYQSQIEAVYLAAIPVTLQRFAFEPQFVARMSPVTPGGGSGLGSSLSGVSPGGGASIPPPNPVNSFIYRTREAPGGETSTLNLGTVAGFGKLFTYGTRVLGSFANQVTFNFANAGG